MTLLKSNILQNCYLHSHWKVPYSENKILSFFTPPYWGKKTYINVQKLFNTNKCTYLQICNSIFISFTIENITHNYNNYLVFCTINANGNSTKCKTNKNFFNEEKILFC